jgi:hypothetical protein
VVRRSKTPTLIVGLAGIALLLGAGCTLWQGPSSGQQAMAAELADALRDEALKVSDNGQRERLVQGLTQLREMMGGVPTESPAEPGRAEPPAGEPRLPQPVGGNRPAPPWATLFAPTSLVIGFFTRSRDFDGEPGDDGLEVRLQPLDQFGDPTKAVGSFRIEIFKYRLHSGEKRGERLGHWFVSVLDVESNRRYYDPVDRSYVFPLLWSAPIEAGTVVIVQATYYPPGGFQEKLFAQRVIKVGQQD